MKESVALRRLGAVFAIALSLCAACVISCKEQDLRIASYNVENLFDDADNGTEYQEYDPGLGKWTTTLYKLKFEATVRAIQTMSPLPDVLCLQEIENKNVLVALGSRLGYGCHALPPQSVANSAPATTVGILSRIPIVRAATHELPSWNGEPMRAILEAELTVAGNPLVIFVCHWKSRSEGALITEPARQTAAATINRRAADLLAARPAVRIVVAGDLNEECDEYEKNNGGSPTALMPEECALSAGIDLAGSLFLSRSPENTGSRENALIYFEPWYSIPETSPAGSYVYQKHWQTLDHLLLLGDFSEHGDIRFRKFFAHTTPELLWEDSGFPRGWKTASPLQGASDHLPVVVVLERNSP